MVQKAQETKTWYFVDESGDPAFYGKGGKVIVGEEGCSSVFLMGFVEVKNPVSIQEKLNQLRSSISEDKYFKGIPSLSKSLLAFHAKDDCQEIRMMVYKALAEMDFSAQVIVARKTEPMFRTKYQGNQDRFYNDMISRLFQNRLHKAEHNIITFSRRGKKHRQYAFRAALQKGADEFKKKWGHDVSTKVDVVTCRPSDEPLLQVVDYVNWAVQRAFHRGEMRFFETIREKYSLVLDVFDRAKYKGGGNYYGRDRNPFDIKKVSSLD